MSARPKESNQPKEQVPESYYALCKCCGQASVHEVSQDAPYTPPPYAGVPYEVSRVVEANGRKFVILQMKWASGTKTAGGVPSYSQAVVEALPNGGVRGPVTGEVRAGDSIDEINAVVWWCADTEASKTISDELGPATRVEGAEGTPNGWLRVSK